MNACKCTEIYNYMIAFMNQKQLMLETHLVLISNLEARPEGELSNIYTSDGQ